MTFVPSLNPSTGAATTMSPSPDPQWIPDIAEEDQFVPKPAQQVILSALKDHPQIEIHTYPGRNHAFARVGGKEGKAAA